MTERPFTGLKENKSIAFIFLLHLKDINLRKKYKLQHGVILTTNSKWKPHFSFFLCIRIKTVETVSLLYWSQSGMYKLYKQPLTIFWWWSLQLSKHLKHIWLMLLLHYHLLVCLCVCLWVSSSWSVLSKHFHFSHLHLKESSTMKLTRIQVEKN